MNEVELTKKLDVVYDAVVQLTKAVKQLRDSYMEILETNKQLVEYVKSGQYYQDFKVVLDEVKRVISAGKKQPSVYHEEVVTPKALRERVIRKGLDSPTTLIHHILFGGVQPIEVLCALSVIREKSRKRWS
jgi:hypothetical protein